MHVGSFDRDAQPAPPLSRAAIDAWSAQIRQARLRGGHHETSAGTAQDISRLQSELELSYEELSVAEAELRAQYEQLASTQLQLERERLRYRDLFEHAPIPYLVTDAVGTIVDANIAATRLLGPDAERLRGKPLQTFIPLGARARFRRSLAELAGAHVVRELVFIIATRHSERRVVSATVNVVRDVHGLVTEVRWLLSEQSNSMDHEPQGQVGSSTIDRIAAMRTIQLEQQVIELDRRRVEAEEARHLAEQSSHDATELLTTVSHELRTPVSAIAGYAELLSMGLHGPLTPEQQLDQDRIQATLDHVIGLLDNLLVYFRAGGGTLPIESQRMAVEPTVRAVASLVQPMLDAKNIQLIIDSSENATEVVADVDRVRQILLNLLSNAVKFTQPNGSVRVVWHSTRDLVVLEVADSGIGIPVRQLERIFKPFVQLATTQTTVGAGFGLGLAISRGLARAMGGDLTARSEEGRGSTFILTLPTPK